MNRKDLLAAGGVAALLAFGWYQFVWQSQGLAAADARTSVAAADQSVAKLKTQVASLERTKTELDAQGDVAALITQAIPTDAAQSSLVKLLQAKAHEHNLTLASISNGAVTRAVVVTIAGGATVGGDAPSEIALTLNLHGAYADVVLFVNDLGSLPRLIVVDAVSLTNLTSTATPGAPVAAAEVSASINARAFTTAEPPSAPGAPATTAVAAKGASGGAASSPVTTAAAAAGVKTPAP